MMANQKLCRPIQVESRKHQFLKIPSLNFLFLIQQISRKTPDSSSPLAISSRATPASLLWPNRCARTPSFGTPFVVICSSCRISWPIRMTCNATQKRSFAQNACPKRKYSSMPTTSWCGSVKRPLFHHRQPHCKIFLESISASVMLMFISSIFFFSVMPASNAFQFCNYPIVGISNGPRIQPLFWNNFYAEGAPLLDCRCWLKVRIEISGIRTGSSLWCHWWTLSDSYCKCSIFNLISKPTKSNEIIFEFSDGPFLGTLCLGNGWSEAANIFISKNTCGYWIAGVNGTSVQVSRFNKIPFFYSRSCPVGFQTKFFRLITNYDSQLTYFFAIIWKKKW